MTDMDLSAGTTSLADATMGLVTDEENTKDEHAGIRERMRMGPVQVLRDADGTWIDSGRKLDERAAWIPASEDFEYALSGGHFAAMVDDAGRRALATWDLALAGNHDPASFAELADAMAALRDVLVEDPPEDYDPTPYIEEQNWIFAKTMPQSPHWYVLLRNSTNWREHLRFLLWIRRRGLDELYRGWHYRYRVVGEHRYWALGPNDTIINRRVEP